MGVDEKDICMYECVCGVVNVVERMCVGVEGCLCIGESVSVG